MNPMLDFFRTYGTDIAGFLVSAALLLAYHLYLRYRTRRNPAYTIQAVNHAARTGWVKGIMSNEGKGLLGVQTLRNSTMAATFLASTAVLLIMGTLTLSGQADKLQTNWHALNLVGARHAGLWVVKLLVLVTDFFVAFFAFALSVRVYNHVVYQLNVPADLRTKEINPASVARHLNRAGRYYSIGMRAYYFSVPLVFWLFGPLLMVASSIVLIAMLYHVDRLPKK